MTPQSTGHLGDRLLDLLYEELPPEEAADARAHLSSCSACTREFEQAQATRGTMSKLSTEPAPAAGLESLLDYASKAAQRNAAAEAKSDDAVPSPRSHRRFSAPGFSAWIASATAFAIVGLIAYQVNRSSETPGETISRLQAEQWRPGSAPVLEGERDEADIGNGSASSEEEGRIAAGPGTATPSPADAARAADPSSVAGSGALGASRSDGKGSDKRRTTNLSPMKDSISAEKRAAAELDASLGADAFRPEAPGASAALRKSAPVARAVAPPPVMPRGDAEEGVVAQPAPAARTPAAAPESPESPEKKNAAAWAAPGVRRGDAVSKREADPREATMETESLSGGDRPSSVPSAEARPPPRTFAERNATNEDAMEAELARARLAVSSPSVTGARRLDALEHHCTLAVSLGYDDEAESSCQKLVAETTEPRRRGKAEAMLERIRVHRSRNRR